jgi:hypothetical protein
MRKNIFKYAFMAACATVLLAACSKEEKIEVGDWNSTSDYAVVSFVETNKAVELDPTESTTYTMHMGRRNPELSEAIEAEEKRVEELLQQEGLSKEDSTKLIKGLEESITTMSKTNLPAIEVPIVITDDGGNETFTISSAKFKEGEWLGEYTISFPKAEVGTTYTVQYAVKDPQFVSYYSSDVTATFSVTRVKWNDVGFYYNEAGQKVEGWVMYTDDCITSIYSAPVISWPTRIQERDDTPGYYRLINTYNTYPYNEPGDWDETEDHYIFIDATNPNQVYIPEDCNTGTDWGKGFFHLWSMVGLGMARGNASYIEGNYGKVEHGKITFPKNALLISRESDSGWYSANGSGLFCVVLNPDEDIYVATLNPLGEEGDFKWEEVFEGEFTSGQLGTNGKAKLYKGVCTVSTDKADSTFLADYGTPYVIEAPYAEGYDIYFFVKDGRIQLPREFESEWLNLSAQPLGFESCGMDTYGQINASSCSFSDNEVVLNMNFVTLNKKGEVDQVLATNDEVLANITWTEFATGTYYYVMFSETDDPEPEPGYKLYVRDDKPNVFKITEWLMGTDFTFTWNRTTNECVVLEQAIGYNHPDYGPMYIIEGANYSNNYAAHTSYYDPATKIFHFFPAYFVEAGPFGQVEEFFEITEGGASVKKFAPQWGNAKLNSSLRRPSKWQPKKVQHQSPKTLIAPTSAPFAK